MSDLVEQLRALEGQSRVDALRALGFEEPQGGSSVAPDLQGGGPAFRRALANPFNLGDEISGLIGAIDPNSSYQLGRDEARWMLAQDRKNNPTASMLGQMTGDIVTGGALAGPLDDALRAVPMLRGTGLAPRMARGAGAGAAEGFAYGYAGGEGVEDRIAQGLTLGGIGAGVGAALPVTGDLLRRIILRPAGGALGVGNPTRAANRIVRAMEEAGMTTDQIDAALRQAAADGQDIFNVADVLGRSGRSALAGATQVPGAGRGLAEDTLETRGANATRRLREYVGENFDATSATARQQRAAQVTSRADDAAVDYDAARASAGPVNVNSAVEKIDNLLGRNPLLGQESDLASSELGRRLQGFRDRMATSNSQLIDFDEVRQLRTDLRLWREQNPRAAALTSDVYGALTDALADASRDFRAANNAYREASQLIEAGDAGQRASASMRFEDVLDEYGNLRTDQMRDAYRLSYMDRDLGRIEGATGNRNVARSVFGGQYPSMDTEAIARQMGTDPDLFLRRVAREDVMAETRNRALYGSTTGENLAEAAASSGEDISLLGNVAAGNWAGATAQGLTRLGNAAKGMNEQTREALARALLSSEPGAITQAIAPAQRNEATMRIIAGLIRGLGRDPTAQVVAR